MKKNFSAEVDYVISEGEAIVPIEVKTGKGGTLKFLHLFLRKIISPLVIGLIAIFRHFYL